MRTAPRRERRAVDVVVAHLLERDRLVAELAEQRHLLREDRRRNRRRVRLEVVDLVVHQHAKRPLGLAVEPAGAADGLADRRGRRRSSAAASPCPPASRECRRATLVTSSTSSRMRRAYSCGVASHGCTAPCAAAPRRSASARSESTRTSASASASASPGWNEEAGHAVLDDVGDAADAAADDSAAAAERLDDDAAEAFRARREHENGRLVERAGDLGRRERLRPARLLPAGRATSACGTSRAASPRPDEVQRRVRDARRGEPPGLREHVDRLVALEHADEERRPGARAAERAPTRRTARDP